MRFKPVCTGPVHFLAAHHFGVEPDMVVLAKALSGGLVPCSAVLMSDAICNSVYQLAEARAYPHLYLQRKQPGDARRLGHP